MKISGICDWTLGAAYLASEEENRAELLRATLEVIRAYGEDINTIEWFGSAKGEHADKATKSAA